MTCAGIISYMNFGTFSLDILGQVRKHKWKMYREGAILAPAKYKNDKETQLITHTPNSH